MLSLHTKILITMIIFSNLSEAFDSVPIFNTLISAFQNGIKNIQWDI